MRVSGIEISLLSAAILLTGVAVVPLITEPQSEGSKIRVERGLVEGGLVEGGLVEGGLVEGGLVEECSSSMVELLDGKLPACEELKLPEAKELDGSSLGPDQ